VLYRALAAADPTGNLVLSPTSIALALTMTAAGARGETLEQMLATLQVGDADGIHRATNALTAQLEARNDEELAVSIANSLWGQDGLAFEQPFLDLLATEHGAGMNLVDYRTDPEAARVAINAWVATETGDRIPELLAEGVVTTDARLTLVNAIYMKAQWETQFSPEATQDIPFTTADGTSVTVPAMFTDEYMLHAAGDGWQAVELPYEGGDLAMLIVVPDAGDLAAFEASLNVATHVDALAATEVLLTVPRFEIGSSFSVGDTLRALGMELAFGNDADFSGMTTQEPLFISEVIHQANISVDENGTEAAAATAVIGEAGSAAPTDEPVELVIDRPFLFVVRDRPTGATLFVGRVANPAA
jgi:serpin B